MKEKDIKDGFSVCGQHRELQDGERLLSNSTVDAEKILDQCFREFTKEEKDLMLEKTAVMVTELLKEGRSTDEFMDSHNIPKLPENYVARDNLVLWRQHAQILTHPEVQGHYLNYQIEKDISNDPEKKSKRKEEHRLNKAIKAYEEKQKKDAEKIARSEQENAKKQQMTAEEKKAADARTKENKEKRKKDKEAKEFEEKTNYEANKVKLAAINSFLTLPGCDS